VKPNGVAGLAEARIEAQWGTDKAMKSSGCWSSSKLHY